MNHRKSAMGRSRDFGTEGAGKGDGNRVTDTAAYSENYDAINWGPSEKRPVRFFWKGLECLPAPPQSAAINPEWVNAPVGIDETVPPYACLDTGPAPEHEDFEIWDR